MRAARTALRLPALPQLRTKEPKRKTVSERQPDCAVWLGAAFLAGYLPGIWLGRDGATALGQQLAVWYTESPESTAFAAAFGTRFAVGALQLCAVLLCGFCIWGIGLLVLFFAVRGGFLGFCAASVAAADGTAGLLRYRRDTAVADVATLLLCLWLAGWSAQLAAQLFCAARGRATRETPGTVRRLLSHFAAAMVLLAAVSAVGSVLVLAVGGGR